jgi:DNA repair protein SbcD/Mre11
MRILHTADLHLGRTFNGLALDQDQAVVLDQVLAALQATQANLLIIAGDLFDRATPPAPAVRMLNDFLSRVLSETGAAIALIAGNHDSPDRIESMAVATDRRRALIRGVPLAEERPLVLQDRHGPVAITGLPFAYEHAARAALGDVTLATPEDVLRAELAAARPHLLPDARQVIIAHGFVAGAMGTEGERPLARVGGIETVDPAIFAGAHYVALGHLHRPQPSALTRSGKRSRWCWSIWMRPGRWQST